MPDAHGVLHNHDTQRASTNIGMKGSVGSINARTIVTASSGINGTFPTMLLNVIAICLCLVIRIHKISLRTTSDISGSASVMLAAGITNASNRLVHRSLISSKNRRRNKRSAANGLPRKYLPHDFFPPCPQVTLRFNSFLQLNT